MMHTSLARRLLPAAVALACATGVQAQTRYSLDILTGLGGTSATGNSINDRGWITGRGNLTGNQSRHATLWRGDTVTDLQTLGGPNSVVVFPVKNIVGIVSGIAQTNEPDPLNETWSCGFFFPAATRTGVRCLGFRWRNNVMTPLPTLGGTHGFASGTNNFGFTVGWAENTVHDPTCVAPQQLQFRAVRWGLDGKPTELPPLPGDSTSAATAINDLGEIVGISGICDIAVGQRSARHAVVWRNRVPHNLGDIGGDAWNTPVAINLRGDIAGFGNTVAGIDFAPHAFLWTRRTGIVDLGTLPGDSTSQASGMNELGRVVGQSCNSAGVCRGFVWTRGTMRDLQAMITEGDDATILTANDIDDFGVITGQAIDNATGRFVVFRATPLD
ncbi:hypothetical protein LVB87_13955 [Lysobacter sp. KIS68-7]|uniref:hypothetical protein n=1 Tax=Lysobacter sp. KIS68-7 TaxID=2904252 RepID=UPI001E4FC910|nr:hypothetical protein [Lysobacter sp. KIS68-7]UHQ19272.1 hypothetical protein LVB87_13955 [Lysobacter sp. KIS68-7]